MYPEDRVLVGVMPDPNDLAIAQERHWYRIPAKQLPHGIFTEYIAFYFTRKFSSELRWGIHYYARRTGHELVRRIDLFPDAPEHPRAQEPYYKIQLAPLKQKIPPILSVRWRRITFIHTTWDRFVSAEEINDLFSTDKKYVDRVYHALKRRGIQPDRDVNIKEHGQQYQIDLLVPCQNGAVMLATEEERPAKALHLKDGNETIIDEIQTAIDKQGGPIKPDTRS